MDGFVLDIVNEDFERCVVGNIPSEWLRVLGLTSSSNVPLSHPPDRLWRTLVANRGPGGGNPPLWYRRACKVALSESLSGRDFNVSDVIQVCVESTIRSYLRRMQSVVWNRRLVKTRKEGLIGLVPKESAINDIICILYGCSVPVVLRSKGGAESLKRHYTVIGECYIDGMMDGEALDIQRRRRTKTETFRIQ